MIASDDGIIVSTMESVPSTADRSPAMPSLHAAWLPNGAVRGAGDDAIFQQLHMVTGVPCPTLAASG
jgi:hypothetical protein